MKKRWRTGVGLFALIGLAMASSASAPAKEPDKQGSSIKGSCMNPTEINKQNIVSDQEIQFTLRNGDVWTNHLPNACFGLKSEGGFEWNVRGTLVCSNQQSIKVLRLGTPCLLGEFTVTPKAPKPAN